MDDAPTDRNRKKRIVSWFFRLLRRLNKKRKINVMPSVEEDQVSNEKQATSKEEYDRVLEERISSLINDQLRRRDDEITMLKNQVLLLKKDLDKLLSNPNVDKITRKTNNSNLSQTDDKAGTSGSNNKEQQPYLAAGFYKVMRRYQNKEKDDEKGVVFEAGYDIIGSRPTPASSAEGFTDKFNRPSLPKFGQWD